MPEPVNFYNTETRQKEKISQEGDAPIKLYTCGPTVYNYAHIGNFRTYVFEDILKRTLTYFGNAVNHVMNLTDVEDKTIKASLEKNLPLTTYTKPYIEAFYEDLKVLNVLPADIYPAATDHIEEMIVLIQKLLEKGLAYQGKDGSIFFRITKFPSYGRLSHLKLDDLQEGASERTSDDEYEKESVSDFVLWKSYRKERDGDVCYESPFGPGRPGWHIECSAMAMKHLGETIDIHVGGVDNIFPHHENEIAQSEGCTGHPFVKHWMHSEHLLVDGKKMSKSLGNFYTLRDLLEKGYTGRTIRYLLLSTHYRKQLNFTLEGLDAAKHALRRIDDFIERLESISAANTGMIDAHIETAKKIFNQSLADDLSISEALAALFDFIREGNALIDQKKVGPQDANNALTMLNGFDHILGVIFTSEEVSIPAEVQEAFKKRQNARKNRDFALSDELRDFIYNKGFIIEDSSSGSKVKKR